jgi:hypothetical protein
MKWLCMPRISGDRNERLAIRNETSQAFHLIHARPI